MISCRSLFQVQACVSYDFYNEFYHKATIVTCLASKG